eukprot:679427_1
MANLNKILTVVYVSVQVTIALFVSVFGAIHVRRSIQEAFKKSIEAPPGDIDDNIKPFKESGDHAADDKLKESPSTETTPDDADGQKEADHAPPSYAEATMEHAPPSYAEATQATKAHALQPDADATIAMDIEDETGAMDIEDKTVAMDIADETVAMDIEDETVQHIKQKVFFKLWIRIVWKMRSVYSGLAVHSFDVLTDVLVIVQWMNTPKEDVDHVDPQIMAFSAIAVILFSRIFSAVAIFIKEQNFMRSILQLFDLLIFQEIYESHHKIVSQFKNNQHSPIESTLSFKYVRNMEAIFESIPEAVLQLVYVMRVGMSHVGTSHFIFIVSIIQSIVSMTNSILNNDHTMMKEDKWKEYKQRLPPSFKFLKHAICRISEIVYRIGLLALFWTVCEGRAFAVLLGIELVLICVRVGWLLAEKEITFDADTILLGLSSVVVIPSEEVYGIATYEWHQMFGSVVDADDGIMDNAEMCTVVLCANICCCTGAASALASIPGLLPCDFYTGPKISFPPIIRIGTSLNELIFLVIWAFVGDNESRITFLLDTEHGLVAQWILKIKPSQWILQMKPSQWILKIFLL